MTAVFIIFILITCILLLLPVLQKQEIRRITAQLHELKNTNTNSLVHSENGTANELIAEINSLLKAMREDRISYNQKNHALEQMMTNISHDLRTPLASAMGYIDLIQHSALSEEEKNRELAIIEKRLIRLEELINSFFELSQIVSSGKNPEKSEINLISILEEAIAHYYDDYCGQNRQIIFHCEQHRLMINSNRNMLMRIVDNLISNALKHGKDDLVIDVKNDSGICITFENELLSANVDMEHIFDEFYTTDISRTKGNTGLGLAIAKQFTEMLGGDIRAYLDYENFTITLHFEK